MYLMTSAVGARSAKVITASKPASRAPALLSDVIFANQCPEEKNSVFVCVCARGRERV